MKKRSWSIWWASNNIESLARVWKHYGSLGYVFSSFLLVSGLVAFLFSAIKSEDSMGEVPFAAIAGVAIGVAALIYAGFAVASLASSVLERLTGIEDDLKKLQKTETQEELDE